MITIHTGQRLTAEVPGPARPGVMAGLGAWTATHLRAVLLAWAAVLAIFGAFAPSVLSSLAGAGWQDSTSQSVAARNLIQRDFAGLGSSALQVAVVDHHDAPLATDPAARRVLGNVTAMLRADRRVSTVVAPQPGGPWRWESCSPSSRCSPPP